MKKILSLLLVAVMCVVFLVACGPEAAPAAETVEDAADAVEDAVEDAIEDVEEEVDEVEEVEETPDEAEEVVEPEEDVDLPVLVMATNAEFPPFQFYVGDQIVGIDVDFAHAIGAYLGFEIVIEDMAFDAIIPSVVSGRADFGMAGLSITEERMLQVDFSIPYYNARQVVIVLEDNEDVNEPDDLEGKSIGVQLGTTSEMLASWTFGDDSVVRYNRSFEAIQSLLQGSIDAVILDDQVALNFIAETEGLRILDTEFEIEEYAIAFPLGSELTEMFNGAIRSLMADGTFDSIVNYYIPEE